VNRQRVRLILFLRSRCQKPGTALMMEAKKWIRDARGESWDSEPGTGPRYGYVRKKGTSLNSAAVGGWNGNDWNLSRNGRALTINCQRSKCSKNAGSKAPGAKTASGAGRLF